MSKKVIQLSATQETILMLLEKHAGKVVSHRALANKIWTRGLPSSWLTMLSLEMRQLRKNVPAQRWQIVNVHGRGYMLGCQVVHQA
jgi:DNA-binding response OmpR family regulator